MSTIELPTPNLKPDRVRILTGCALLLLTVWLAYLPALHGGPVWDDRPILTQSQVLFGPHAMYRIWFDPYASPDYFPLTLTVFWLQTKLWGGVNNLTGYHAVNVCLHGLNALLVWATLSRLHVRGSFLAAALFAVHPIMVESVAWVSELKNTLSGVFAIVAVLLFVRSATWTSSLTAAAMFALAMLAKSAVVGLPVAIVLLLWWKRRWPGRSQQVALLLMFITAAALAALALWTQSHVVGTVGPEWDRTPVQSVSIFGPAALFYLGKLVWPTHLALLYTQWTLPNHLSWQHALGVALLAGLLLLWRWRASGGRAPLAAMLMFLILLAPVLGLLKFFTQRYCFVSDHYTYLACIPILAIVGAVVARAGPLALPSGVAMVAVCAVLTWQHSHDFVDDVAAFRHVAAEDPDNWEANDRLGMDAVTRNNDAEAESYFRRAVQKYPEAAETWVGLGGVAERSHDYKVALADYQQALACRPTSPIIHFDLANQLLINRNVYQAIAEYRVAIDLEPTLATAHDNLGVALLKINDRARAADEFRAASSLDPNLASARRHLASLSTASTGVKDHAAP